MERVLKNRQEAEKEPGLKRALSVQASLMTPVQPMLVRWFPCHGDPLSSPRQGPPVCCHTLTFKRVSRQMGDCVLRASSVRCQLSHLTSCHSALYQEARFQRTWYSHLQRHRRVKILSAFSPEVPFSLILSLEIAEAFPWIRDRNKFGVWLEQTRVMYLHVGSYKRHSPYTFKHLEEINYLGICRWF